MKLWAIAFFVLPLLGAGYVSWRIWHLLPWGSVVSSVAVALVWLGLAVMIGNFVVGLDKVPLAIAKMLYEIGNSWIFILLYLVMLFLLIDVARLVHLLPRSLTEHSWQGTLAVAVLMVGIFVYGNIHYRDKKIVELKALAKNLAGNGEGNDVKTIVMMSDLHLGYHNDRKEFSRWVDMINAQNPDLILIAGDIIDISVRPLIEEKVSEEFKRLKAPVYACLGNHEYYSGEPKAQRFYKDVGINLLQDSVAVVGNLCIIGRDDRSNPHRESLGRLMKKADTTRYTILLDHQPYYLEQAEKAGIDFQFSGHTHHGQVWPISWITEAIYEKAFGEHQRGKTRYYVSSGLGIWGGKFRIGTQSEMVVMKLE